MMNLLQTYVAIVHQCCTRDALSFPFSVFSSVRCCISSVRVVKRRNRVQERLGRGTREDLGFGDSWSTAKDCGDVR